MHKTLLYGISALALLAATPSYAYHWGGGSGHWGGGQQSSGPHGGSGGGSAPHVTAGGGPFRGGARFTAPAHAFAGRNFSQFSPAQRHNWSGGHWWHGRHNGHSGWWWGVGGGWFLYPFAAYPYPTYVSPDAYYDDGDYASPGNGGGYGGGGSWYYCDNPKGYYPYVQSCNGSWRAVAPTPPGMQDNGAYQQGPDQGYGGNGAPDNGPPDNGAYDNGAPGNGPPDDGASDNGAPPNNPPPPPRGH